MSKESVFCIATTRVQAEEIVDSLKNSGFSPNDISVLFPDKETNRDFANEKSTKAPEGAASEAGLGGVLVGALGWLVDILISVHTENSDEIKLAKEIFTQANAQDICVTGESSASNDKTDKRTPQYTKSEPRH